MIDSSDWHELHANKQSWDSYISKVYKEAKDKKMIEIEINPIEPGTRNREVKVWISGNLVYANAIATPCELREWRDALHNELQWMDRYMRDNGLEEKPSGD